MKLPTMEDYQKLVINAGMKTNKQPLKCTKSQDSSVSSKKVNYKSQRSVEEIVEEITGRFSELLDDAMIENVDVVQKQYFNMHFKPLSLKYLAQELTQTLQAERQDQEEAVREQREKSFTELYSIVYDTKDVMAIPYNLKEYVNRLDNDLHIVTQSKALNQTNNLK